MKKCNIIKENSEYNRLIQTLKPVKYHNFIAYIERDQQTPYQFGFSVGKKIGNAVIRNRIKRQIKSILDKKVYQNNFKCIIMVRRGILNQNFSEMEQDLNSLIDKLKITKGTNE